MIALAIALAVSALSLYGIVHTSLRFTERFLEKEETSWAHCSLEQLNTARKEANSAYNWWAKISDTTLCIRECKKAMETIAEIDAEYARRLRT